MTSPPFLARLSKRRSASRATLGLLPLVVLMAAPDAADAQESNARRTWSIEPRVSLRETLTDNHRLQTAKEADSITEATAGIRLVGNGWIKGFLDYALTGVAFARHSGLNGFRNELTAIATAELIDHRVFVDLRGDITQQNISAFGTQSPDPSLANANRTEVTTFALSPYVRGRLASHTDYEARLSHEVTRTDAARASDVTNSAALLHLDGWATAFGWTADLSHHVADFSLGRRTEDRWVRGGLRYIFDRQLLLGVNAGRESNNFVSIDNQSHSTWGVEAKWTPSERTSASATYDRRFFGGAHSLSFAHRTPRTVVTFIDSRNLFTGSGQGNTSVGTPYDLYFRQFASIEPDPVLRDVLVRNFLQANGINPNSAVISGFLASAATVQRIQALSFALVGLRNTLTFRAMRRKDHRLDTVVSVLDDLATSGEIRQRGLMVDFAHSLTRLASINLMGSYVKSTGDLGATELKGIAATWTGRLSMRSDLSTGARYVVFNSTLSPYNERALFATYRLRF